MSLGITGAPSGPVTTGAADGAGSKLSAVVGTGPSEMSTAPSMSFGGGVEGRVPRGVPTSSASRFSGPAQGMTPTGRWEGATCMHIRVAHAYVVSKRNRHT